MAYQGSSHSHYRPQVSLKKENMDTQLLPSAVFCDRSAPALDPALLYSTWSVFNDDVKPAATFPDGNLSRSQVNLSYSGNGPDVFGMVSSILEEPNPENLSDWNSSSKLFPLWASDSDQIDQEKMLQFGNGSSDVIDINNFHQDAFQKMEGDDMESLYHSFQGLDLMDSWLLGGRKDSDLPSLESTHFTNRFFNQDEVLKANSFSQRDDFGFNKRDDPCMQDGSQEVLNGGYEKIPGEFGIYAFHNRSNSNNTRLQKEFKVVQGRDKFSRCSGTIEQARFPRDPSSPPQREKWPQTPQQRPHPFRGYEDYNIQPQQRKTFSTSQSHHGLQHIKVNGRGWKTGEHLSANPQNGYLSNRKPYDQLQMNTGESPCDFTAAANLEIRNGDYLQPGKGGPIWSEGDGLSPSWKSSLQNGRKNSPAHSPQVSGLSNMASNGNSANHLLAPSPQPSYRSHSSPVSPRGRQDRRTKQGECRPGAWLRGPTPGNANLNMPGSHSKPDLPASNHNQHSYLSGWPGCSAAEDLDKYLCNRTKHSPDGRNDNKVTKKNNNWFSQPNTYGGPNWHQYGSSSNKNWHKQDQDRSNASDFNSTHFSPPFQLMMGDLKQNSGLSQIGLHGGASGGGSGGSFPLPQSGFPFPDLMDLLQGEDLSHLSPFVSELLNGDVPPPYFGFPPFFNKYRPMRNRSGPANELHVQLELCYEQWRTLEKERKKTEANLARNFPGRRVSSSNNTPIPCLPANPSRVDRLIVDQLKEQARIVTLVGKMERLRSAPVHTNITTTLERHLEAIHFTQQRRKDEIVNTANRQRQGAPRYSDDKDVLFLAAAIKELAMLTRKARTALWCALQMTLPKSVAGTPAGQAELERALLELCNPAEGETRGLADRETQPAVGQPGEKEAGPRGGREAKAEQESRANSDVGIVE
ncbi:hypothetical protein JZ751_000668 [Albula glossodonta]|uniref:Meiosis-specific coiled-coil domain-containing protein MEIOC n=1 Tax=Albula glossodonta TaxID=121402 RepID=A0A8T2PX85_9TELE|nr:hypothetical protein JZ751_000668 [Albula glossodonta]